MGKYGKKWGSSRTSIDRYIEKAKPLAKELSNNRDKAIEGATLKAVTEAAKMGLKSVLEIDLKVQEIIFKAYQLVREDPVKDKNGAIIRKGKVLKIENTTADQIKAIDIYYKRHGHYETDNKQRAMLIKVTRK